MKTNLLQEKLIGSSSKDAAKGPGFVVSYSLNCSANYTGASFLIRDIGKNTLPYESGLRRMDRQCTLQDLVDILSDVVSDAKKANMPDPSLKRALSYIADQISRDLKLEHTAKAAFNKALQALVE